MAVDYAEGPNVAAEQLLREALEQKWAKYQQAVPEDRGEARRQYQEALRRFTAVVGAGHNRREERRNNRKNQ